MMGLRTHPTPRSPPLQVCNQSIDKVAGTTQGHEVARVWRLPPADLSAETDRLIGTGWQLAGSWQLSTGSHWQADIGRRRYALETGREGKARQTRQGKTERQGTILTKKQSCSSYTCRCDFCCGYRLSATDGWSMERKNDRLPGFARCTSPPWPHLPYPPARPDMWSNEMGKWEGARETDAPSD